MPWATAIAATVLLAAVSGCAAAGGTSPSEAGRATPSSIASEPDAGPSPTGVDIAAEDAREYAEAHAVPEAVAQDRLNGQAGLSALLGEISALAGPRLAGAFLQNEPEYGGVVKVTGEEPLAGVDSLLDQPHGELVTIEYGFEHSEQEMVRALSDTPWTELSPAISGTYFDPVTDAIVVILVGDAEDGANLEQAIAGQPQLRDLPVTIELTETISSDAGGAAPVDSKGE